MRRKRLILIPFLALAAVTALGATAFACTIFRGTFTINGNATGSTAVTATGNGADMGHKSISSGIAKATKNAGTVTVSTGVDPANTTNKLPNGGYLIRFFNSVYTGTVAVKPGFKNHTTWTTDCMADGGLDPTVKTIGTVTVNGDGTIAGQPKTFPLGTSPTGSPLTPDQAPAESAVCISDAKANTGNQAPLTIV